MIDKLIVLFAIGTFILYVITLAITVRVNGQKGILTSLKQVFIILTIISSAVVWITLKDIGLLFLHLVLLWSLSFAYILCLFGLPLTSLRMQILLTISKSGDEGIGISELSKKYSHEQVLEQRIVRLESSKEIVKKSGLYRLRSSYSYFMLHNRFLLFLIKLYRPFNT